MPSARLLLAAVTLLVDLIVAQAGASKDSLHTSAQRSLLAYSCKLTRDCPTTQLCINAQCTCPSERPQYCLGPPRGCKQCCNTQHCGDNMICYRNMCKCAANFADCDGLRSNGCEASLTTTTNCGLCGRKCAAHQGCVSGQCRCLQNFADCDDDPSNGCERDLQTSIFHCGKCGGACANGMRCQKGTCKCPGSGATNLLTDAKNCGQCGNLCGKNMECVAGQCVCSPNFGDCDGNAENGCEAPLLIDTDNCFACGRACGAHAQCTGGKCSCLPTFADCNNDAADGCETQTTSTDHCGACGGKCASFETCAAVGGGNACACASQDLTTDANCGACGNKCHATQECVSVSVGGAMQHTCRCKTGAVPLLGDCNGWSGDGCETPLNTIANCGACGAACPDQDQQTCTDGVCTCPVDKPHLCETSPGVFACSQCCNNCDCPGGQICSGNECESNI